MGPMSPKPTNSHNMAPNPLAGSGYNMQPRPHQYNVGNMTTANGGRMEVAPRPQMPEVARDVFNAEQLAQPAQSMPSSPVAQPVAQQSAIPAKADNAVKSAPAKAQDIDQIEQAWVDQTKKVISATRDDPFEQAHQVAELMRDYIRKRYNKLVGKAANKH